jgi:hypothetical protein
MLSSKKAKQKFSLSFAIPATGLQPITKSEKKLHSTLNKEIFPWLGEFQPFPKDGKPIKNWNNPQDGFLDVIKQLKKYL